MSNPIRKMTFCILNFKASYAGKRIVASPFGPRFRLRRNHALQARFRHTASIADARGGGCHFADAPQRRGYQGAGLNRHDTDASEDRAAALECGELT